MFMKREQQTLILRQFKALKQFQAIQKENVDETVLKGDKSGAGETTDIISNGLDRLLFTRMKF